MAYAIFAPDINMLTFISAVKVHNVLMRELTSKARPLVKLDEQVENSIQAQAIKPRNHPGRLKIKTVVLPDKLVKAVECVTQDHPVKALIEDSAALVRHLRFRLPPVEKAEVRQVKREVFEEVLQKEPQVELRTKQEEEQFKQRIKDSVQKKLNSKIYNWTATNYNIYNCLLYLFGRFAADYSALLKIFSEINFRDAKFKPRSFFDFGSGTGTATWAANHFWKSSIFEYFNVDSSGDMNDLAQLLLKGGDGTKQTPKGTFYRQFLPASNVSYDLVVCAYSLLELPSLKSRLQIILNLWNKTDSYLVIVEQGTNAGFKVVNEARDFILSIEDEVNVGHVFSPCASDTICPRFLIDDTPCNFESPYYPLPHYKQLIQRERYCYVVLKKGRRDPNVVHWPRIVRRPLIRSKHSICRMCTDEGKLEEIIFTASKHGKTTYHCARSSEWGDLLPIEISKITKTDD